MLFYYIELCYLLQNNPASSYLYLGYVSIGLVSLGQR